MSIITRYSHKKESRTQPNTFFYFNIFESLPQVKMCEGKFPEKRFSITLEINSEGNYWGWLDYARNEYCMIYPHRELLEICFPYGMKAAIERGKGEITRFNVIHSEEVENEVATT